MADPTAAVDLPTPAQMRAFNGVAHAAWQARRMGEASRALITGNIVFGLCVVGTALVVMQSRCAGNAAPFVMCGLVYGYLAGLLLSLRWMKRQRARASVTVVDRREAEMRKVFVGRASAALKRELDAVKESYRYRLKELQDRSREQELTRVAKELLRQQAEATQPGLFEEIQEEATFRVHELEEQMMQALNERIITKSVLFRMADGRVEIDNGQALLAANPRKHFLMGADPRLPEMPEKHSGA